jgi:uncharacterized protein (TIGR03382 family)
VPLRVSWEKTEMMRSLITLSALLATSQAWALGTFIAPDGSTVPMNAARTIIVRGPDSVQFVTQVNYAGNPAKLLWMIPLPNFNMPADDGVLVGTLPQGAFDELEGLTAPRLEGACDGAPNGMATDALQRDAWAGTNMPLPARAFPIPEIEMGRLAQHASEFGVMIDETAQAAIDGMVDQNFMVVAVRIDTAALGVNRVDPIVSIRYPLAAGEQVRTAIFPTNTVVPAAGPVDFVWWTLGAQRMRSSLPTEELDFTTVEFVTNAESNYTEALDAALAPRQTQVFIREFAGGVDGGFADAGLEGIRQGATQITRLRARFTGPALRATRMATPTLRDDGTTAYDRTHSVAGFMCPGDAPDMGAVVADVGVTPDPDLGMVEPDTGIVRPDGGVDAAAGGGGGGGGGCHASPGAPGAALLALLAPALLLRRRRSRQ